MQSPARETLKSSHRLTNSRSQTMPARACKILKSRHQLTHVVSPCSSCTQDLEEQPCKTGSHQRFDTRRYSTSAKPTADVCRRNNPARRKTDSVSCQRRVRPTQPVCKRAYGTRPQLCRSLPSTSTLCVAVHGQHEPFSKTKDIVHEIKLVVSHSGAVDNGLHASQPGAITQSRRQRCRIDEVDTAPRCTPAAATTPSHG